MAPAFGQEDWSSVGSPTQGPALSIGKPTRGCIAGAAALPWDGAGYSVVHLSRHRYYGHPALIRYMQTLGRSVEYRRLGLLQVGDLAQPRGGPMAYGHQSHQTGLDVDIWFKMLRGRLPKSASDPFRDEIETPSLLEYPGINLDHRLWDRNHAQVLELAARAPDVDRIFVNPVIKRELCQSAEGDRTWLHKIRPWYGHDDHFHVRLHCPPDSPACVPQAEVPPGDGCDGGLVSWLRRGLIRPKPRPPGSARPRISLPAECSALLRP